MLAGTSAGSVIISLLLHSKENILERMKDFLQGYQPEEKNTNYPDKPMYDIDNFYDAVQALHTDNKTINAFDEDVLMTAFDIGNSDKGINWDQVIFSNLDPNTANVSIVDATVSSGAMPGMYGAYAFGAPANPSYMIDGAFAHHDPSLIAIAYAIDNGISLDEIVLIDIGTGFMPQSLPGSDVTTWGSNQWIGVTETNADVSDLLANQSQSVPILDITLNGTNTHMVENLASMMLPGQFAKVNPQIKDISETDTDPKTIEYLIDQGSQADISDAEALIKTYW